MIMALNELIAQGAQFKTPDLLGQYSNALAIQNAMQANQMNQIKMDDLRRASDEQNKLRSIYAGITDFNDPNILNKIGAVSPRAAMDMAEFQRKSVESGAKTRKENADATKTEFDQFARGARTINSDEGVAQHVAAMYAHPVFGPIAKATNPFDQALSENLALFKKNPLEWRVAASNVTYDKVMDLYKGTRQNVDLGGTSQGQTIDYQGRVVPGSVTSTAKTATPGELMTNARGIESNRTVRDRFNWESNPEAQATMAGAKEGAKIQTKNVIEAQAALPTALKHVEEVNDIISQMIGDAKVNAKGKIIIPEGGAKPHKGFEVSVGASAQPGFQYLSGTDKANFYALKDQIMSDAFLTAYKDSLKGGGSITEIEGEKGTQALLRARTSQSEAEFVKAMREFQRSNARVAELLATKAGTGMKSSPTVTPTPIAPQASTSVTTPDGQTYTFPDAASAAKFRKQAGL